MFSNPRFTLVREFSHLRVPEPVQNRFLQKILSFPDFVGKCRRDQCKFEQEKEKDTSGNDPIR